MLKPLVGGLVGTLLLQLPPAVAQPPEHQVNPQVFAQAFTPKGGRQTVSPLELQQFAQALRQLRRLEMETREKMAEAIKSERLSPERFQEIGQQRSNPDAAGATDITPAEQQRFDNALAKIQTIRQEATPKQSRAITLQGLTVERFSQISEAIDNSPALQQQIQRSFSSGPAPQQQAEPGF